MKDPINKNDNEIQARVEAILDDMIAIRRDLHAHPELSQQERRTAAVISQHLTEWGIPHRTGIAGYGVTGLIRGKADGSKVREETLPAGSEDSQSLWPVVAIRADIDALPVQEENALPYRSQNPGVMHACGHDIHTAILLGTAKILKDLEDELPGGVKLLFQPAEETVGGALPMIRCGCLESPRVDAVIGLHVEPDLPAGALRFRRGVMNAASNEFTVTVKGSSSHGARPHNGVDAILAACQIVSSLQSIVSRNVSPTDSGVITVGQFHAGTAGNIVAGEAVFSGIVRTLRPETRQMVVRRVREVAETTAAAFGAIASVDFRESYPALVNDEGIEAILEREAARCFEPGQIFFQAEPSMGAEDFSYFCDAVPGAYFNIGTNPSPGAPTAPLHSERFCPDERCIRTGILMEVKGALAILKELRDSRC